MKKYFKSLGIALVYAPFAITGVVIIATGMICKAAGYALFGDFQHATDEIKQGTGESPARHPRADGGNERHGV